MGFPTLRLPRFPITPANSLEAMNMIVSALDQLQQAYADNWRLFERMRQFPWISLRVIRIAAAEEAEDGLEAGWYSGFTQKIIAPLNPKRKLLLEDFYEDATNDPDCYVFAFEENGVPSGIHRWKDDGSVYVIGWYQDRASTEGSDDSTQTIKNLPVFMGISRPTGAPLPCTLENPQGSEGTNGPPPTAADLTYNIIDLDGSLVAANAEVWFERNPGHVTPAKNGFYFSDWDDSFKIIWCDEVIDAGACTP